MWALSKSFTCVGSLRIRKREREILELKGVEDYGYTVYYNTLNEFNVRTPNFLGDKSLQYYNTTTH